MYFFCLLFCDLFQGIGALLNIPWIVERRVFIGAICTAQSAIKQFGNVREVYSLQRRVDIDAFHGLRLEQRFSLLSSPPIPSASSFFVDNGLVAHATSSSSPHGVSLRSTYASGISSLPTSEEDHTMEYLATGAGSQQRTQWSGIPQSTSLCSPRLGSPSSSICSYFSDYAATSILMDTRSNFRNALKSELAERLLGHTS
jgi:hypothetical protein